MPFVEWDMIFDSSRDYRHKCSERNRFCYQCCCCLLLRPMDASCKILTLLMEKNNGADEQQRRRTLYCLQLQKAMCLFVIKIKGVPFESR